MISFDKEYKHKSLMELRKAPVAALSGIRQTDAESLKNAFRIDTIEELAMNKYVFLAQAINAFSKYSGKILDKEFNSVEFDELRKKPVSAISGISDVNATLLENAFGINTIQDLAENKYIKIAQLATTDYTDAANFFSEFPLMPLRKRKTTISFFLSWNARHAQ